MTILSSAVIAAAFTFAAVVAAPGPNPPMKNGPSKSRGPQGPRGPRGPDGSTDGSSASETGSDSTASPSLSPSSLSPSSLPPTLSPTLSPTSVFSVSSSLNYDFLSSIGPADTDVYGQLIVPGDGTVTYFYFLATIPTNGIFTGNICEWDDTIHACTGLLLFKSGPQSSTTASSGLVEIDVAPAVATESGKTYCMFIDTDPSSPAFMGRFETSGTSGRSGFVYTNNKDDHFSEWDGYAYGNTHAAVYRYTFHGNVQPNLYSPASYGLHLVLGCSSSSGCPADEESSSATLFERLYIAPVTALAVAGMVVAVIARNWKKSSDFTPLDGESESHLANGGHIVNKKFQMII
jgi:hypothetical protein